MDKDEALKLALEALGFSCPAPHLMSKHEAAEAALRAALEKPEQEPVAWMVYTEDGKSAYVTDNPHDLVGAYKAFALYTHPPTPPRVARADEFARRGHEVAVLERQVAALEQPEPTVKESLMVPQHIAEQLTTTDLAWLETRRLVRVWKELGQMRWMGADEGWDKAIEAVRVRLDKECQDVLAWKEKADASGETAKQVLQRMRGLKDD